MTENLQELFLQRETLMRSAKDFLKDHADDNGQLSAKDAKEFDEMQGEISFLTHCIDKESAVPTKKPILNMPNSALTESATKSFGVAGDSYKKSFFNQIRDNFKNANNELQTTVPAQGGYLLPEEFHNEIISRLQEENVLRQIGNVIFTAAKHKIVLQENPPTADFVEEGQEINLSDVSFGEKTLDAYKLACGVSVTNELLADSFYNLEDHLTAEFSKAVALKEEDVFLNGDGVKKPTGLLNQLDSDATITTAGVNLAFDDLINLVYKLTRPYRHGASWLMSDSTLAAVRKLKDSTLNYLWQDLNGSEPPKLLGYPVFTSEFMPPIASGNVPILFGDFSKFVIGQRGELTFKPLYELHALRDCSTYLMIERIDCCLSDGRAIRGLKIQ